MNRHRRRVIHSFASGFGCLGLLTILPAAGQDESAQFFGATDCDYGGNLKSVEALDELTVVVTLCNPDAIFAQEMASLGLSIHPQGISRRDRR